MLNSTGQSRLSALLILCFLLLGLTGCGGNSSVTSDTLDQATPPGLPAPDSVELSAVIDDLDSAPAPEGVDPQVYRQLSSALAQYLTDHYPARITSTPPMGSAGRVTEILLSDGILRWTYQNGGDYNSDGLVTVNDLTSIGVYWKSTSADSNWPAARIADGNGDGEVNVSDITPIGQNFLSSVAGYKVLSADSAEGPFSEVDDVEIDQALEGMSPRQFELSIDTGGLAAMLFVQPYDSDGVPGELSDGVPVGGGGALDFLAGPPADPAADHLPELGAPVQLQDDYTLDSERSGLYVSRTQFTVVLEPDATVGDVNVLLSQLGGRLVGAVPELNLLIIRIDDPGDLSGVHHALDALPQEPSVTFVVEDTLLGDTALTSPSSSTDPTAWNSAHPSQTIPNPWQWDWEPSETGTSVNGNWGMEAVRAPMAWNLFDYARRQNTPARVVIADIGFNDAHADGELDNMKFMQYTGGSVANGLVLFYHGSHVAGIVGAPGYNDVGVSGINPLYQWVSPADEKWVGWSLRSALFDRNDPYDSRSTAFSSIMIDIWKALRQWDDTAVINTSLGYNWWAGGAAPIDTAASEDARRVCRLQGQVFRFFASYNENILICTAAGNDSAAVNGFPHEQEARYASPMAWAGLDPEIAWPGLFDLGPMANIIVVESTDSVVSDTTLRPNAWEYTKSDFSNVGGHVSAPGSDILSTVGSNLRDDWGRVLQDYETLGGTSMATPLVAGLISYLASIDPTLTPEELRTLVTEPNWTTPVAAEDGANLPDEINAPARMVDAFAAVTGIDTVQNNLNIQRALADVDDGTRDGNLRTAVCDDAGYTNPPDPDPDDIDTPDHRRGDGKITMKDFRAWRDAWLAQNSTAFPLPVQLDGGTYHFKRDYNFDGAIHTVGNNGQPANPPHPVDIPSPTTLNNIISEERYSRYDLNGDGEIADWAATSPYRVQAFMEGARSEVFDVIDTPNYVRDIDVLASTGNWNERDIIYEQAGEPLYYENVSVSLTDENQPAANQWSPQRFLLGNRDADAEVAPVFTHTPDYLHSCDFHFNLDWSWLSLGGAHSVTIIVTSEIYGVVEPFVRTGTFTSQDPWKFVLTVPIWTDTVNIDFRTDAGIHANKDYSVALGADIPVRFSLYLQIPDVYKEFPTVIKRREPVFWVRSLGLNEGYYLRTVFVTDGNGGKKDLNFSSVYSMDGEWSEPVVIASVDNPQLIAGADLYGYPAVVFDDGNGNLLFKTTQDGIDWNNFDRIIDSGADFDLRQLSILQRLAPEDFIIYSKGNGLGEKSVYCCRNHLFSEYQFSAPEEVGAGIAPSAVSPKDSGELYLAMFDPQAPSVDAAVRLHQWSTDQEQFLPAIDLPLESLDGGPGADFALETAEYNGNPAMSLLANGELYWIEGIDGESFKVNPVGSTGTDSSLLIFVRPQIIISSSTPAIFLRGRIWQASDAQGDSWQAPFMFNAPGYNPDPDYMRFRSSSDGLFAVQFIEQNWNRLVIQGELPEQ
jgi:subtilisin family serine protease